MKHYSETLLEADVLEMGKDAVYEVADKLLKHKTAIELALQARETLEDIVERRPTHKQYEHSIDRLKEKRFLVDIERLQSLVRKGNIILPPKVGQRVGRLRERKVSIAQ